MTAAATKSAATRAVAAIRAGKGAIAANIRKPAAMLKCLRKAKT